MSTLTIVRHCAPTLAGLKVGNLFSARYQDPSEILEILEQQNQQLNPKGVYFVLMKMGGGFALIYVYRKQQLEALLQLPEIIAFLRQFGYHDFSIHGCLAVLKKRLLRQDFPHDIGVFLGYPLADIQAFIQNKGANCKCIGCWKAYTDLPGAEKKFALYKKCTQVYCQRFCEGTDITRLTVAG